MKLITLTTHPFAGVADRTIHFEKGTNVVLGANEAGKSTMLKALYCALFYPTRLTPTKLEEFKARFFSADGGDCAQVTLHFGVKGQLYRVSKRWGENHQTELRLPGGGLIRNEMEAHEMLMKLAGYNAATYSHVLMANQTELTRTIDRLKEKKEALHSLHHLLRETVMSQGNINTDQLKAAVDRKVQKYDDNWEPAFNRPRDGKDLNNRHKNKVGHILEAFYQWREAREAFEAATHYERELDALVSHTGTTQTEVDELAAFLTANAEAYRDVKAREQLLLTRQKHEQQESALMKAMVDWPGLVKQSELVENQIQYFRKTIDSLNQELGIANRVQQAQHQVELFRKASRASGEWAKARAELGELRKVLPQDVRQGTQAWQDMQALTIRIEAQRLQLRLLAPDHCEIVLAKGLETGQAVTLQGKVPLDLEVKGRFTLRYGALSVTVAAGTGEVKQLMQDLEKKKTEWTAWLSPFGAKTLAELDAACQVYTTALSRVEQTRQTLELLLKGTTLEELDQQVSAIRELPATRSTEAIQQELVERHTDLRGTLAHQHTITNTLQSYREQYQTPEALADTWQQVKMALQKVGTALGELHLLPENYTRADAFLADYERSTKLHQEKTGELHRLQLARKELEKRAPEWTCEELVTQVESTCRLLEKRKEEAAAYRTIQTHLEALLTTIHAQTYTPLYERTRVYLSQLTGQRYSNIGWEESLPVQVTHAESALPVEQLSQGTAGSLALALRLAMAEQYLADQHGFLILDDPLVDMDPERQEAAVRCLRNFARDKQVIVLTCHPLHAERLGGKQTELARLERALPTNETLIF